MRHADDDLLQAELPAALDHLLERRHHQLAAVEPEALGAGIFHVEEALEDLGLDQLLEDRLLALRREANVGVRPLEPVLDPLPLLGIGDMHVLRADMLAVDALQNIEDLAKRAELEAERAAEIDRPVVVRLGEAVGSRPELRMLLAGRELERIELGDEMAARAVVADQHAGGKRVPRRGKRLLLGEGGRRQHLALKPVRRLPGRSPRLKQHIVLVVP